MNHQTKKWLRQLGVVFLIAAVMTVLPRVLVSSVMMLIRTAIMIGMIYILFRVFGPIINNYLARQGYRGPRKPRRRRSQNYFSDRR